MKRDITPKCDTCKFSRIDSNGEVNCNRFHGLEIDCIQALNIECGKPCSGYVSKSDKVSVLKLILMFFKG